MFVYRRVHGLKDCFSHAAAAVRWREKNGRNDMEMTTFWRAKVFTVGLSKVFTRKHMFFVVFFKVSPFRSIFRVNHLQLFGTVAFFQVNHLQLFGEILGIPNQRARGLEDVSTIANAEAGFAGQIRWWVRNLFGESTVAMFSLWCR